MGNLACIQEMIHGKIEMSGGNSIFDFSANDQFHQYDPHIDEYKRNCKKK